MDFARKQLEKYGWTAGKGLGKNENGISEALKPKLKRSVTGVGHDLASDFTEHWWNDLYNKAAKNVEVEEVNGKVKKFKSKEASFEITNNTWQIKKKKNGDNPNEQYTDYFVRTAILSNGASKIENINTSESEEEELSTDIIKMTDEELFAACEGRTAHKGARHGLKALGKLARIEQQEQILLNESKYNGYSTKGKQSTKIETEKTSLKQDKSKDVCDIDQIIPKKKKKKHRNSEKCSIDTVTVDIDVISNNSEEREPDHCKRKKDKRKGNNIVENEISKVTENNVPNKKKKLSKQAASISCETDDLDTQENEEKEMRNLKKKKKDKRKIDCNINNAIARDTTSLLVECNSENNEENIINIQKDSDNILSKKRKKKKKNCKDM